MLCTVQFVDKIKFNLKKQSYNCFPLKKIEQRTQIIVSEARRSNFKLFIK